MPGVQHWQVPLVFAERLKPNVGTEETVIAKCVMRANTVQPGCAVKINVMGIVANNANIKKVKLRWNDVLIVDTGDITTGGFVMEAVIVVGQEEMFVMCRTTVGEAHLPLAYSVVKPCSFKADIICRITGVGVEDGDIVGGIVDGQALAPATY